MRTASILERIARPFRRYRIFAIFCSQEVVTSIEDGRCPREWRGSGCFDTDVFSLNARALLVTARDRTEALAVRERHLEEELRSAAATKRMDNPGLDVTWWLPDLKEKVGFYMDVNAVMATGVPLYADDERKAVLDEIVNERIYETEREKDLKEFTDDRIVKSFRYDLEDWAREHDRRELIRLTGLLEKETSHLLCLLLFLRIDAFRRHGGGRRASKNVGRPTP